MAVRPATTKNENGTMPPSVAGLTKTGPSGGILKFFCGRTKVRIFGPPGAVYLKTQSSRIALFTIFVTFCPVHYAIKKARSLPERNRPGNMFKNNICYLEPKDASGISSTAVSASTMASILANAEGSRVLIKKAAVLICPA